MLLYSLYICYVLLLFCPIFVLETLKSRLLFAESDTDCTKSGYECLESEQNAWNVRENDASRTKKRVYRATWASLRACFDPVGDRFRSERHELPLALRWIALFECSQPVDTDCTEAARWYVFVVTAMNWRLLNIHISIYMDISIFKYSNIHISLYTHISIYGYSNIQISLLE